MSTTQQSMLDSSIRTQTHPSDVADVTSEPTGNDYTRAESVAVSASDISGNWGIDNDAKITFSVGDASEDVDSYFFVANFAASDDSGTPTDHLVLTGSLSQTYDLNSVDTLEISANTAGVTVN
jgi:hypothetical protein